MQPLSCLAGVASLLGIAACAGVVGSPVNPPNAARSGHAGDERGSTMVQAPSTTPEQQFAAQQFLSAFDDAWSRGDVDAAVSLFAEDATLETPLAQRLLHRKEGVLHGRDEIREMVRTLMAGGRAWGGHEPPLVRGNTVAIEFRSPSADGGHYSVDVIELKDGKIRSLRAYLGWRALTPPHGP